MQNIKAKDHDTAISALQLAGKWAWEITTKEGTSDNDKETSKKDWMFFQLKALEVIFIDANFID